MNLSPFIKCTSFGFLVGFLISKGPEVGRDVLPLVGLIAFIAVIFALWELANLEPPAGEAAVGRDPGGAAGGAEKEGQAK